MKNKKVTHCFDLGFKIGSFDGGVLLHQVTGGTFQASIQMGDSRICHTDGKTESSAIGGAIAKFLKEVQKSGNIDGVIRPNKFLK